jgi:hypothetical protein
VAKNKSKKKPESKGTIVKARKKVSALVQHMAAARAFAKQRIAEKARREQELAQQREAEAARQDELARKAEARKAKGLKY